MTTTTSTSTAPGRQVRTLPKRRRRRIRHLYWPQEAEAAREMGVQVRHLCGVWSWDSCTGQAEARLGASEGGPSYLCRNCLRVMHAQYRAWGWE